MKPDFTIHRSLRQQLGIPLLALLITGNITEHTWAHGIHPHEHTAEKDRTVTGTVTTKAGEQSLPGVNIVIKGMLIGTTTDANGNYSITVDENKKQTLIFSYIGYDSQEITVSTQSVINVLLEENVTTLDEAVVTALGIKRATKSLTSAITKVDGEDLVNVAQENIMNSLAARVPGLVLNQTSGVGSSTSIVIRGAHFAQQR